MAEDGGQLGPRRQPPLCDDRPGIAASRCRRPDQLQVLEGGLLHKGLEEFRTASNYIAAGEFPTSNASKYTLLTCIAMIFLSDNALLERDLTFDDIKPRQDSEYVLQGQ